MFKNKYPGKFIAIEGLDGAGATTQVVRLNEYLKKEKLSSLITQEPTNGSIGGIIRSYLSGEQKMNSAAGLQLLFAADRATHLENEIIPKLKEGTHVISDRYFLSSVAYGSLDINNTDWLYQINDLFILPDLTILIKTSAKTCIKRIKERRLNFDIFESESKLERVWGAYEAIAKKYPNIKVVDGEKGIDELFIDIKSEIKKLLK